MSRKARWLAVTQKDTPFIDGAVIGSKEFVNEAFESARERFGEKRKTGARKLRGDAAGLAGVLWSARDLKRGI